MDALKILPRPFKIGLIIQILFCWFIGIGVFLIIFFQYPYPEIKADHDFKNASCIITGYNDIVLDCQKQFVGTSCYHYAASLKVTVVGDNEMWNGTANKKNNYRFNSYESAAEWQNNYPVGIKTKCYYNPKKVERVVLEKGMSDNIVLPITLASIFLVFTLIAGPTSAAILGYFAYRNQKNFLEIVERNRKSIQSTNVDMHYHHNL